MYILIKKKFEKNKRSKDMKTLEKIPLLVVNLFMLTNNWR